MSNKIQKVYTQGCGNFHLNTLHSCVYHRVLHKYPPFFVEIVR